MSVLYLLICRRKSLLYSFPQRVKTHREDSLLWEPFLTFISDTYCLSCHLSLSFLICCRIESFVLLKILVAVAENLFL